MKLIVNGEIAQIPTGGGGAVSSIPSGGIIMWSGADVPDGWALCNGENGTPDLRGMFVLGASDTHPMGETGGSEKVRLTVEQMPSHDHSYVKQTSGAQISNGTGAKFELAGNSTIDRITSSTGSGQSHNNMPPYYTLAYIMKL